MTLSQSNEQIISIVIVSWNTREILARCLDAVSRSASSALGAEVIVVDNASSDGSAEMVRQRFPGVRVISNEDNLGFARACNQGIRVSSGEYVLLLNPDTEVQPAALETLITFLREHPNVAAAGARITNPDGSLQRSCYRAPGIFRELWRLTHMDVLYPYAEYPIEKWSTSEPRPVDTVLGACLLVRREALEQVGLLDERFFIYSEEVDLCTRLRAAGWEVFWVPRAIVMHRGGESTRQVAASMFLRLYQGKVLYFRKHRGRGGAALYKVVLAMTAAGRLLLGGLALLEKAEPRKRHLVLAGHYGRLILALRGM